MINVYTVADHDPDYVREAVTITFFLSLFISLLHHYIIPFWIDRNRYSDSFYSDERETNNQNNGSNDADSHIGDEPHQ